MSGQTPEVFKTSGVIPIFFSNLIRSYLKSAFLGLKSLSLFIVVTPN